jgi:tRNA-Thr(GGU) m(6)t(6)A37 methyltransferase TsaA
MFSLVPIAFVESAYWSQESVPRQSGLIPEHLCDVVFERTTQNEQLLRGIEEFSHLWLLFWLHQIGSRTKKSLVHPPRASRKTCGTLATRSPYRPNPIGLSVVELREKKTDRSSIRLVVGGADVLDGSPVIDVKPYIPYVDSIPDARAAWASERPNPLEVQWSPQAESDLRKFFPDEYISKRATVSGIVAQDPRPFHQKGKPEIGTHTWRCNYGSLVICWILHGSTAQIMHLQETLQDSNKVA